MGPVFLYPTYMVDIYIPVWDNAGVPAGRAALFRNCCEKTSPHFSSERLSDIQMFFVFYIKQRSRYFQDPSLILSNMSCISCPMQCNQHNLCYTMFSRSLSNDWCTYTCHTQILFSIYEQVAMCYVYYCISNWSSCWTRVHLLLL